jgi:hypothetical protein
LPFDIQRVYYLYDVPGGAERGGHGHFKLRQLIVAMSGSFDVVLDDGKRRARYHLNRSYTGLYVVPDDLARARQLLVGLGLPRARVEPYDEADYLRDYETFRHSSGIPMHVRRARCAADARSKSIRNARRRRSTAFRLSML